MSIQGAVLTEAGWTIQSLTRMVSLQLNPYDDSEFEELCRVLWGLKHGIAEMKHFYASEMGQGRQARQVGWPTIRRYGTQAFRYTRRFLAAGPFKAVYQAETLPKREEIVVKFVKTYSAEAHRLLAELGMAPKLLYYSAEEKGFEKVGGLDMVVMEFLEEEPGGTWNKTRWDQIKKGLEVLHETGFVFGDLRKNNILLLANNRTMLIDFDWSGKAGKARYPMSLNVSEDIDWAPGTERGGFIEAAHDKYLLARLGES